MVSCSDYAASANLTIVGGRPAPWRRSSRQRGRLRPTAAMMADVTDHLWNFDELYRTVSQYS